VRTAFLYLMETTNYSEAETCARGWLTPLLEELATQHGGKYVSTPGTPIQSADSVLHTVDVGGALMQLAVESKHGMYKPLIIVTERVMRKYRTGIGPSHRYYAMRDGIPNFKKAISNTLSRASEIAESPSTVKDKPVSTDDGLAELAKAELAPLRIPPEFIVSRQASGLYILHVGTMQLTYQQLQKVCHALLH
jgi:hypothetical protein